MYEVRYDPAALAALGEAANYIEGQSGIERTEAWLDAMLTSIEKLEESPRAFPVTCFRRGRPIHSKVVKSHRVYYFIDAPSRIVYIVDVVHTARETRLSEYRDRSE